MRICLYTNTIYKIGGVARVTTFLANHWAKNHDVTIISTNPDYSPDDLVYDLSDSIETVQDSNLFIHDKAYTLTEASLERLKSFVDDHHFDVIIGVEGKYAVALSPALKDYQGIALAWMHNSFDAYFRTKDEYLWGLDDVFKHAMARYNAVVVLTNHDKTKFDEHFGIASMCIVNPITFNVETPMYNVNSTQMLTVCRVVFKHKGLDMLLDALPFVFEKHPEWSWHLVGDGPDLSKLKEIVETQGLSKHVVVHGSTDNVRPYYENAAFFILPSRWEGMPMVSLEAMSFALPLVGFKIDALQEVLGDYLSEQLLVKRYDIHGLSEKICALIEDVSLRQEYAFLASNRVHHFTLDSVSKKWEYLFNTQ